MAVNGAALLQGLSLRPKGTGDRTLGKGEQRRVGLRVLWEEKRREEREG